MFNYVIRIVGRIGDRKDDDGCTGSRNYSFYDLTTEVQPLICSRTDKEFELKPLLLISSRGGSTEAAVSMHGLLKQVPCHLAALGVGQVDSAAVTVFLAASERIATPTTRFMIHEGTHSHNGLPVSEVAAAASGAKLLSETCIEIVAQECRVRRTIVREWFRQGKYFSAKEALKYGLIHRIARKSVFKGQNGNCDVGWV